MRMKHLAKKKEVIKLSSVDDKMVQANIKQVEANIKRTQAETKLVEAQTAEVLQRVKANQPMVCK